MQNHSTYHDLACDLAISAADREPYYSRGIWHLEKEDLVCVFDCHPYDREPMARTRQMNRIVSRLREYEIQVLAESHDGCGLATVLLLDCSWDRVLIVKKIVSEEVETTLREIFGEFRTRLVPLCWQMCCLARRVSG